MQDSLAKKDNIITYVGIGIQYYTLKKGLCVKKEYECLSEKELIHWEKQ